MNTSITCIDRKGTALCIVLFITALLGGVGAPGCGGNGTPALEPFLQAALKRHPTSELQDLYKLLYQGAFGPGHSIVNADDALRNIEAEIRHLDQAEGEPLHEPCSVDGSMIRVNLRPFLKRGLSVQRLAQVMLETAGSMKADTAAFVATWAEFGDLVSDEALPFDADEYEAFTRDVLEQRFPAMHHSDAYLGAYKPAYRVVRRDLFNKEFSTPE